MTYRRDAEHAEEPKKKMGSLAKSSQRSLRLCGVILLLSAAGCAPEAKEPAAKDRSSDKAMRDPMGYRPDFDRSDISGGGIGEFDREGFKRDLDNVLNP